MKLELSTLEARELLRPDVPDHWSWEGTLALIEYLESLEDSSGEFIEFDRIALRCEYCEYANILEAAKNYDISFPEDANEDEIEETAWAYFEDRTTVIRFESGVIIQLF